MPESIWSLWPTLHPRQRDAVVAKVRGWHVQQHHPRNGEIIVAAYAPGSQTSTTITLTPGARPGDPPIHTEVFPDFDSALPRFNERETCVQLLEEMLAAGCEIRMQPPAGSNIWVDGHEAVLLVAQKTAATIAATGDSWPDRIALAYVLWKGNAEALS